MTTPAPDVEPVCPECGPGPYPDGCWFLPGYPWCRPCGEHHRPPECDVDDQGRALASCGCPWEAINVDPITGHTCAVYGPGTAW